jgi:hypothetical protein
MIADDAAADFGNRNESVSAGPGQRSRPEANSREIDRGLSGVQRAQERRVSEKSEDRSGGHLSVPVGIPIIEVVRHHHPRGHQEIKDENWQA